jgi:hypothetical protein
MLWTKESLRSLVVIASLATPMSLVGCGSGGEDAPPNVGDSGIITSTAGMGGQGGGSGSSGVGTGITGAAGGGAGAQPSGTGASTTMLGAGGWTGAGGVGAGGLSGTAGGDDAGSMIDGGTGGDPRSDAGRPATPADFEGIDLTTLPRTKVSGCAGTFDPAVRALTLALDSTIHSVFVDAFQGTIRANETVCTTKDGVPITPAMLGSLVISGTAANDYVAIDLLLGDFGAGLLGQTASIKIDLGAGTDTVAVRGTGYPDRFIAAAAAGTGAGMVDLGMGAYCLRVDNIESMVFSLGPSSDTFHQGASSIGIPLVLYGGSEDDVLEGGSKNDILNGGDGSDELEESAQVNGADILNGGPGFDLVSYEKRTNMVNITLCSSTANAGCTAPACTCAADDGELGERDVVVNVENATGGAGDDTIVGDSGSNVLSGKNGNDRIDGGDGSDEIFGDNGDDVLRGGLDDDVIIGGTGNNTIDGQTGVDICFYNLSDPPPTSCEVLVPQ